jgi:hypothetical protein
VSDKPDLSQVTLTAIVGMTAASASASDLTTCCSMLACEPDDALLLGTLLRAYRRQVATDRSVIGTDASVYTAIHRVLSRMGYGDGNVISWAQP